MRRVKSPPGTLHFLLLDARAYTTSRNQLLLYRQHQSCYNTAMANVRRSGFVCLTCALWLLWAARPLGAQLVAPADEPFFEAYRRGDPITKWPLKTVLHQVPELKRLKPATDQSGLPEILRGVSANLQKFVVTFVDTTALETIEGTAASPYRWGRQSTVQKYRYLMLARREGGAFTLAEYRTNLNGRKENSQNLTLASIKTTGFAAMPLFFGPLQQPWSDFRYLGQQTIGGDPTEAVAFAEHVDPVAVMGRLLVGGASLPILLQGVAWIRTRDHQILQMRTDLLGPLGELRQMTTVVLFARTEFQDNQTVFWLPQDVKVKVLVGSHEFSNRHRYSNYQMFRSKSVIRTDVSEGQQY